MTVVQVPIADALPVPRRWEMPSSPVALRSPVPQGVISYSTETAIAAKTNTDQTLINLVLTLPSGFAYLPRIIQATYQSDDLSNDFNNIANCFYNVAGVEAGIGRPQMNLVSPGEHIFSAGTRAAKLWTPENAAPKLVLAGGDELTIVLADMSADSSAAGDFSYFVQFYVFDVDQVDKWEVNAPIPVISHTAF